MTPDAEPPLAGLPNPPSGLVQRTGRLGRNATDESYDELSAGVRELIVGMLPEDWSWEGKRILDFGCGAGRVMRHFTAEAEVSEFTGCDIHGPSVDWMKTHLCPPFHAFQCSEEPGLPQPDGYFDLIYAISVYTHLTDHWSGWLLEHHRVLAEGGLLLVSFLGEGMIGPLLGEAWDENLIGMNALGVGTSWDEGGPITFHSPWWLRAHWGRAFEVLELVPHTGTAAPEGHGLILLRRTPASLTRADLERAEPDEPRELTALAHHVSQLQREAFVLRRQNDMFRSSLSWRVTKPLRTARERTRR